MITKKITQTVLALALCTGYTLAANAASLSLNKHPTKYLGDADLPSRPAPIEWGDPMLGPGKISKPDVLGTGVVINKRLWIFGSLRTALHAFRTGPRHDSTEWVNRIDLFANLQLTGTERVLLHLRPLNKNNRYTGYVWRPDSECGFNSEFTPNITQLFFEGEFSELFPNWAAKQRGPRDTGFAIGRQQIFFQDGIFINDFIDALALTQNSLSYQGINNLQISAYLGVHNIDRDDSRPDRKAGLLGVHASADIPKHTIDIDVGYVDTLACNNYDQNESGNLGNLIDLAVSSTQRIGLWDTTFRAMGSYAPRLHTRQANDGVLLYFESAYDGDRYHDIFYFNAAAAIGQFTGLARDATTGGALGRVGILFASAGIGDLGSAINSRSNNCVAAAAGLQKFINFDWQAILELGGRLNTDGSDADTLVLGARLQRGIGKRVLLIFDAFGGERTSFEPVYGFRTELLIRL